MSKEKQRFEDRRQRNSWEGRRKETGSRRRNKKLGTPLGGGWGGQQVGLWLPYFLPYCHFWV
jgi:hypothetical protein